MSQEGVTASANFISKLPPLFRPNSENESMAQDYLYIRLESDGVSDKLTEPLKPTGTTRRIQNASN
jgi:hypothetical protein